MTASVPSETQRDRYPNFNAIRLFAAMSVIFSHAFAIAGEGQNEPLARLLGPADFIGIYAVFVFFIISGFLVTQSALKSRSPIQFAWKRFLRVYPAAIVCCVICVVIGAFFTTDSAQGYMKDGLKYLAINTAFPGKMETVRSVLFYRDPENDFGILLNGSIWTIRQELFCYAIMAVLLVVRAVRLPVLLVLLALSVAWSLTSIETDQEIINSFKMAGPAFFAGGVLYLLRPRHAFSPIIGAACLCGVVLAAFTGHLLEAFPVLAAYPVLLLGTSNTIRLPSLKRLGDISYGTYLYGWPTEQLARAALGDQARWWSVLALSLPSALLLGWLSWHLLERRALRLKTWPGVPSERLVDDMEERRA